VSKELLLIDFACNDPNNGTFTGRCEKIALPKSAMDLDYTLLYRGITIGAYGFWVKHGFNGIWVDFVPAANSVKEADDSRMTLGQESEEEEELQEA